MSLVSLGAFPVDAVQLSDGTTHFTQIPRLLDTQSTNSRVRATARHYFTIDLPSGAGEALGQVTLTQTEGSRSFWRYGIGQIRVFEGTYAERGRELPLESVTFDPDNYALTLKFTPPVEPGRVVTIAVPFFRNPHHGTILMFAVHAFPAGDNPVGQFLGYGRFHFYETGGRDDLFH